MSSGFASKPNSNFHFFAISAFSFVSLFFVAI